MVSHVNMAFFFFFFFLLYSLNSVTLNNILYDSTVSFLSQNPLQNRTLTESTTGASLTNVHSSEFPQGLSMVSICD